MAEEARQESDKIEFWRLSYKSHGQAADHQEKGGRNLGLLGHETPNGLSPILLG